MKEKKMLVVFTHNKKIDIPDPAKIILAVRGKDMMQHQASLNVDIPNIRKIKKHINANKEGD